MGMRIGLFALALGLLTTAANAKVVDYSHWPSLPGEVVNRAGWSALPGEVLELSRRPANAGAKHAARGWKARPVANRKATRYGRTNDWVRSATPRRKDAARQCPFGGVRGRR